MLNWHMPLLFIQNAWLIYVHIRLRHCLCICHYLPIQYSFSKLRFCSLFKVLFCVLWFSTLQCKTMDTILWQYVNKQIMEKIQGLKNFDQNSHDVQLLYVCCLENCLSSIRCSGNHKFVYIRGNVDFNIFVILDWHWLHF